MAKGVGIAGLVVGIMAVAASGVAQYLPRWVKIDILVTGKHGVWRAEISGTETDWLDVLDSDTDKRDAQIVRYVILGGGVLLIPSLILISVFICGAGKRVFAATASVFCMLAMAAHVASVVYFHFKFEPEGDSKYSYSFYIAIAAAALSLVSGILKIIAAVMAGTKVDDSDGYLNKNVRSNQGKSNTRSYPTGGQRNTGGYGGSQTNRSYGGSQTNRSYGGSQTNRGIGGSQTNRGIGGSQTNRSYGGSQTNRSYGNSSYGGPQGGRGGRY